MATFNAAVLKVLVNGPYSYTLLKDGVGQKTVNNLATVAAEISGNDSNIENVSVEPGDSAAYSYIHFTLQVHNRLHLAQIMRGLRRLPEVIRITRLKG